MSDIVVTNEAQRIYVGGFEPSRGLTATKVSNRIKAMPELDIISMDDGSEGSCCEQRSFLFLTAKLKNNKNSSSNKESSALELIKKSYHNVKWMGCKLSVELARMHFLERLKLEREELTQKELLNEEQQKNLKEKKEVRENDTMISASNDQNFVKVDDSSVVLTIRRHLRIRRSHGEEAYQVDTKPHETTDWSEMTWSLNKCRSKREKHYKAWIDLHKLSAKKVKNLASEGKLEKKSLQSKSFLNRSVHLRFSDKVNDGTKEHNIKQLLIPKQTTFEKVLVSSPEPVSESESSSSYTTPNNSDDDNDSDEEGDHNQPISYPWSDDNDNDDDDGDEDDDEASKEQFKSIDSPNNIEKKSAYVWSDDEENNVSDESDSEEENRLQNKRFFKPVNTFDEFTSAIDEEVNFSISNNDDGERNLPLIENLIEDVKANLNILSRIFPEFQKTTPNIMPYLINSDEYIQNSIQSSSNSASDIKNASAPDTKSGWGSNLIMQRYDPTIEDNITTKEHIPDDMNSDTSDDNDDGDNASKNSFEDGSLDNNSDASQKEDNDSNDEAKETKKIADSTEKEQIYEQTKLENIFQQAREIDNSMFGFHSSCLFQNNNDLTQESSTAKQNVQTNEDKFSFSFDVKEQQTNETNPGTFNFSFDINPEVNEQTKKVNHNGSQEQKPSMTEQKKASHLDSSRDEMQCVTSKPILKRRLCSGFLQSELDHYEHAFLELNEGIRVVEDWKSMKDDEENQTLWGEERKKLTLDWTRKEKYAKKQRKIKYR